MQTNNQLNPQYSQPNPATSPKPPFQLSRDDLYNLIYACEDTIKLLERSKEEDYEGYEPGEDKYADEDLTELTNQN